MSNFAHLEKELKTGVRLCLTGSVITLYNELGEVLARYFMKSDKEAQKRFFTQCELLEKYSA